MAEKKRKIRPTVSNARAGKNGVFLAKHNDGLDGKAAQMDGLLYTWHCYQDTYGGDFEWAETFFYRNHFTDGLDYQNAKHKKKGNYGRVKEMDDYRTSEKTCPESTLYYLGDRYFNAGPDLLRRAVADFLAWRAREYPQIVTIDWALHQEDGAPHVHDRHVWVAHDEDGHEIVCQEKALAEMGVPRHDEARYQADMAAAAKITDSKMRAKRISQINRYNNRKMTYTETCREKMIEIARSYGIEVEDRPREAGQKGLSQAKYKTQDERRKAIGWRKYNLKMQDAAHELQTAIEGDLEGLEVQRAEAKAKRFITALGGSVEAVKPAEAVVVRDMRTAGTKTALDAAMEQPGQSGAGEPIRTALMQQVFAMVAHGERQSGPTHVEGPTR